MIHLDRLSKPDILEAKQKEWTDKFIASGKSRPDFSKYGHSEISETLRSISFNKCYYCERKLTDIHSEIDHYIEVSDTTGKALAFDWENLFLACQNCNNKFPNSKIPVNQALNPFYDSDYEIESHLTFENEIITAQNNSEIGLRTIQKFKLDSDSLDKIRSKHLLNFKDVLLKIRENQIANQGRPISAEEKQIIQKFAQKDAPFSLMFKLLLKKVKYI